MLPSFVTFICSNSVCRSCQESSFLLLLMLGAAKINVPTSPFLQRFPTWAFCYLYIVRRGPLFEWPVRSPTNNLQYFPVKHQLIPTYIRRIDRLVLCLLQVFHSVCFKTYWETSAKYYCVTSVCNIVEFHENCNTLVHPLHVTIVRNLGM